MSVFSIIASSVGAFLSDRAELAAEIAALRQQLSILQHSALPSPTAGKRPLTSPAFCPDMP